MIDAALLGETYPFAPAEMIVSNVILMPDRNTKGEPRPLSVRDRRYCIRYPFAAETELLDLESGARTTGVTSDLSLGGVFVCTSRSLPLKTRARMTLTWKSQKVEALVTVRIVKPRVGMGVEFIDLEPANLAILTRWIEQLRNR